MPSGKVTSNSATKSFGIQNATKSIDSFTIKASAIPVTLIGAEISASKNVQDALENLNENLSEIGGKVAAQSASPGSPVEGDIWYDTDDDKFYIRDEDSWNEVVVSGISGTVDGGGFS